MPGVNLASSERASQWAGWVQDFQLRRTWSVQGPRCPRCRINDVATSERSCGILDVACRGPIESCGWRAVAPPHVARHARADWASVYKWIICGGWPR